MNRAEMLEQFASRYIWWKTPAEALERPERIMAQVMDIGDYSDVQLLTQVVPESELKEVLLHAEAGQLSPRSWHYWHYRLGLAQPDQVPPLPVRKFA